MLPIMCSHLFLPFVILPSIFQMAIIYQCSNLPMYWYCRTSVEMTTEGLWPKSKKTVFDRFPNCTCEALTYFPLAIYFISWNAVLELTVRETSSCGHFCNLLVDVAVLRQMSSQYEVCTFWCVLSLSYMYLLFVFCLFVFCLFEARLWWLCE